MARGKELEHVQGRGDAAARSGGARTAMNPFRLLVDEMDRMFDEMHRSLLGGFERGGSMVRMPFIDVEQRDEELVVNVELPGISPKDVHLECREEMLVIRGERREERDAEGATTRQYSSFYREIALPAEADVDQARASVRDGLLRVHLPLRKEMGRSVRQIPITAESGRDERGAQERSAASERAA